jgi:hypothetical protein
MGLFFIIRLTRRDLGGFIALCVVLVPIFFGLAIGYNYVTEPTDQFNIEMRAVWRAFTQ